MRTHAVFKNSISHTSYVEKIKSYHHLQTKDSLQVPLTKTRLLSSKVCFEFQDSNVPAHKKRQSNPFVNQKSMLIIKLHKE